MQGNKQEWDLALAHLMPARIMPVANALSEYSPFPVLEKQSPGDLRRPCGLGVEFPADRLEVAFVPVTAHT